MYSKAYNQYKKEDKEDNSIADFIRDVIDIQEASAWSVIRYVLLFVCNDLIRPYETILRKQSRHVT